eukprot:scaffold313017_cov22-Attheya_sp.AAC.1
MENLYERLKFSQLQRIRMNRFVRLYKEGTGEHQWGRMLATDDMCEILNDWLKTMPTPDLAEAWQELSHLVGVGRRCIRHTDVYYTNATVNAKASPKSSTKPKMSRQKQRIYELLVRATKGRVVPGRKMTTNFFFDEIKNLTTSLDPPAKTKSTGTTNPAESPQPTMDPMREAVDNVMASENRDTSPAQDDDVVEIAEASGSSHGAGSRLLDDDNTDRAEGQQQRTVNYFNGDVEEENDLFIDSDDDAENEYIPEEMDTSNEYLPEGMDTMTSTNEWRPEELIS